MRGRQTTRLIRLLLIFCSRRTGESVADLARELNASVRTVYRDLVSLQEAGLPLVSERDGEYTIWRLTDVDQWRFGVPLCLDELMALHAAGEVLRTMGADHWTVPLGSALDKIDAAVPGRLVVRLAELVDSFSASKRASHDYRARSEIVAVVGRALADRRPLDVQYATPGRESPTLRRLLPYHLHLYDQGLYLVAHDSKSGKVRTFLCDRIRLATLGEGTFDLPASFDADRYFARALGVHKGGPLIRLEVLAKPRIAHLLEERLWHPSQRIERTHEGAYMTLEVADSPELRAWLCSFGGDLIVLSPEQLSRDMLAEAERVIREHAVRRGHMKRAGAGRTAPPEAARKGPARSSAAPKAGQSAETKVGSAKTKVGKVSKKERESKEAEE